MTLGFEDIPKDSHFMPHDDPRKIEMLLETVSRARQSGLLTTLMEVLRRDQLLFKETELIDFITTFLNLSRFEKAQLVQYPPFYIWFHHCIRSLRDNASTHHLRQTLYKNKDVIKGFHNSYTDSKVSKVRGTRILVQRYDIDPLVKELVNPEYQFPNEQRQKELEKMFYPISFFADVLDLALERIKNTWPAAHEHVRKFVKIICQAPGAPFRSSSATKFAGVVFVSNAHKSIIDLEDSLVHECAHQVLYCVNEAYPLINWNVERKFKLPWSGAERDWYGLIHATYIYVNLALYFDRLKGRSEVEQLWGHKRKVHIINGLVKAIPLIEENSYDLTPSGMEFFRVLKQIVKDLKD